MQKDTKTLVLAILLILAIALIVFNFGDVTGKATKKEKTIVEVDPVAIMPGEYVNIKIYPTSKGVYAKYRICAVDGFCIRDKMRCHSMVCRKPLVERYKSYSYWEGVYYVEIFDYETRDFIIKYFTIG